MWRTMKMRCYNKNNISYKYYGKKGIKICNEWLKNFVNFKNWAFKNGYKENLLIDRIDNNKNYCATNCRWVTFEISNKNRGWKYKINNQKCITIKKLYATNKYFISDLAKKYQVDRKMISNIIHNKERILHDNQ